MVTMPPPAGLIRVMLVDDHPVVLDGYRHLLDTTLDIRVVAEAGDGETACVLYADILPDVVVLDLCMPGIGGLETLRRLKAKHPTARILMFSMYDDDSTLLRTLEAGAAGFLTKSGGVGQMVEAVRRVAGDESFIDPRHIAELIHHRQAGSAEDPLQALTLREFQLFQRFAEGQSVAEAAGELAISPKTVAVHRVNIMRKLGLRNTSQLVRLALRCHLIEP